MTTNTNGKSNAERPKWMDEGHQSSWDRIKQTLTTEFAAVQNKVQGGALQVEDQIAAKAIEFGHAARRAFDKMGEWGKEVDEKLRPEWQKFETSHGWERVVMAVKFGFQHTESSPRLAEHKNGDSAEQKTSSKRKKHQHKGPNGHAKV